MIIPHMKRFKISMNKAPPRRMKGNTSPFKCSTGSNVENRRVYFKEEANKFFESIILCPIIDACWIVSIKIRMEKRVSGRLRF